MLKYLHIPFDRCNFATSKHDNEFFDMVGKRKKNDGFDVEEVEYRASRLTSL